MNHTEPAAPVSPGTRTSWSRAIQAATRRAFPAGIRLISQNPTEIPHGLEEGESASSAES
jgi:hypothetical protein